MISDPIADLLTRIRNASLAKHQEVEIPYSRIKEEITKILKKEGYIKGFKIVGEKPWEKKIVIGLKYKEKMPVIRGIERISKPGRRIYARADKIPKSSSGLGITIVSTPQGLMTDKEARKKNLGGEIICKVW